MITTELGATVRGDPLWLARAVDNLLENGRIHGRSGARSRSRSPVAASRSSSACATRARSGDTSEKRLFRRFVTTRADRGGTGPALAIVRAIAEAHSGSAACANAGHPRSSSGSACPPREGDGRRRGPSRASRRPQSLRRPSIHSPHNLHDRITAAPSHRRVGGAESGLAYAQPERCPRTRRDHPRWQWPLAHERGLARTKGTSTARPPSARRRARPLTSAGWPASRSTLSASTTGPAPRTRSTRS